MRCAPFLFVLLSGCATTGYPEIDYSNSPPRDWPILRQQVGYGTEAQVTEWCARSPDLRKGRRAGCALVYFDAGVCVIYLTSQDPALLKHEQAHCAGYDHVGEYGRTHKALEIWKLKRK